MNARPRQQPRPQDRRTHRQPIIPVANKMDRPEDGLPVVKRHRDQGDRISGPVFNRGHQLYGMLERNRTGGIDYESRGSRRGRPTRRPRNHHHQPYTRAQQDRRKRNTTRHHRILSAK